MTHAFDYYAVIASNDKRGWMSDECSCATIDRKCALKFHVKPFMAIPSLLGLLFMRNFALWYYCD
jgi:hypothetical protein